MEKNDRPILWFVAVLVLVLSLMTAYAPRAAAQQPKVISNAFSNTPTRFDVSPPLGSLVSLAPTANSSNVPPDSGTWPTSHSGGRSLISSARSALTASGHGSATWALPYPSVASMTPSSAVVEVSTTAARKSSSARRPHRLVVC